VGDAFFDPDQEQGPSNAHHGGGGPNLKVLFLELQQILGKYPDLSEVHLEGCGPRFLIGIEFKPIEVEVGLLPHGQDAAVLEFDAQHGCRVGLDMVPQLDGHSHGGLDGARNGLPDQGRRAGQPRDLADHLIGTGGQRKGQKQQGQRQQPEHQSDRRRSPHFRFHHGILTHPQITQITQIVPLNP